MSGPSERKPGSRQKLPVLTFPLDDPFASMPKTAQKILAAAQTLLNKGGYHEVTLEHVAAEAGVNKASIRYNFGNKAGLVTALVDAHVHAEFARMAQEVRDIQHDRRLDATIEAKRRMILSTDEFRGYFDILPHAMRDPELSCRIAALYPWWCEQNLTWLDLQGTGPEGRDDLIQGLGQLMSAVVDGLAIQAGLGLEDFDPSRPLEALSLLIANSMAELEERAAMQGRAERAGRNSSGGSA